MPSGLPGKLQLRISTKIIVTELSPMSPRNLAWAALAGRQGSVSATTTTTDGMTCSAVSGDTTFCSTITVTELSPTSLERQAFTMKISDGELVAPFLTTIATATSISSSVIT